MDTILLIVVLVISLLACVVSAILLAIVIRRSKAPASDTKTIESIGEIKATLQSLHNDIPSMVDNSVTKKMVDVQKQLGDSASSNAKSMSEFSKSMTDTLANNVAATNKALQDSIVAINKKVDDNFKSVNDKVNSSLTEGFKGTSDTMSSIKERLAKIDEAQKSLDGLQKQVVTLNGVLSSNQKRGQYGEFQLSMILEATFPDGKGTLYDEQYVIKHGNDGQEIRPDAVVFFKAQHAILCIDSKFPLPHYAALHNDELKLTDAQKVTEKALFKSDVKSRIEEVASKYIIRGITLNQALLFIPNDGVFAYIHDEFADLTQEALRKNVVLVSPSIIQPILVALHEVQLDAKRAENLNKINEQLKALGDDFARFSDRWAKVQSNVETLKKNTDLFGTSVDKIGRKFDKVVSLEPTKKEETPLEEIEPLPSDDKE
jgi:DNA recombination protein RmuC